MEAVLQQLFSKGNAQNLFIVRCDDDEHTKRLQVVQTVCSIGKQRSMPIKEVMEWETSADLAKKWDAEEAQKHASSTEQTIAVTNSLASGSSAASNTTRPTTLEGKNAQDPITIAWGQLCKRKLWILCPFGSCSDEKLLRSAAVEILCARTYECHPDFRIVLLCNRREFDRLPRVVRVLSGLKFGTQRYAVIPRVYQPEYIEEPIEEYLNYDNVELAADAPELANFQEQVFNSDPLIRIVHYDSKRFGRGDLFIRIMRDALKFNLTVHTLDLSKSKAGDIICHCLTSILHTTRKLHHLVLSECSLTDAGIVELSTALRKNDAIWTLNISKNPQITDVGIVALASIFAPGTKSRLEGLDISFNNAIYDTPKQWSRAALIALWETLPRHPFLKYVSIAGCSLGSHHFIDLCDRWLGRYRRVTVEEWQQENDPDVDYHTAALRRKQQKARRLKLQREQQKAEKLLREAEAEKRRKEGLSISGGEGAAATDDSHQHSSDAAKAFAEATEELEQLEEEFLEPWEKQKRQEEKEVELERIRLENESKLFDSCLVSLNVSENTIGDAVVGLLMESLPMGLKRLNLEHVSMGATGFRAVAYALSELHLTLEEINLSHNNSLLLTRRLLMDAEGDDDFLEAGGDIPNQKVDDYVYVHTPPKRKNMALSSYGEPLVYQPPALEHSDWARFYVPPPKKNHQTFQSSPGNQNISEDPHGITTFNRPRPSMRQSLPADTRALFSQLISPGMVAVLQADSLYQSIVLEGWTFPPAATTTQLAVAPPAESSQKEEGNDNEQGNPNEENQNNSTLETAEVRNAVVSRSEEGGEQSTAIAAADAIMPFFSQVDPDRIVRATLTAPPRDSAVVALMKALEDNFRLHTLNLSATLVGDEGIAILCDKIVSARCGVRCLDISFNGNVGEESSHKIKELLIGSYFTSNQLKVSEDENNTTERSEHQRTQGTSDTSGHVVEEGEGENPLAMIPSTTATKPPRPLNPANISLLTSNPISTQSHDGASPAQSPSQTSVPLPSALANPDRPPSSPTGGHQKRVTTPLIAGPTATGLRAGRGRLGSSGGNSPSNSGLQVSGSRPGSNADTASLNSTIVSTSVGGGSSASSSFGTTLSTISSFFQDVEGNTVDTDIGVIMNLNLAGNTTTVGERALLALYRNTGLQVLDLRSMGLTDGMLQPLADTCDASLRINVDEVANNQNNKNRPKRRLQLMMPKDSRRGSFDSCDYYDYDSEGNAIAPKLKVAHPIQQYFNPELSLTKLYLGGHNTFWRAGVKHIAAFIKNSNTLQELYLDNLWSHFVDDLGQETSLSRTKREGLFFMEPLLEALSGGMYSCELLKTFSTVSSVSGGDKGSSAAGGGASAVTSLHQKRSSSNTLAAIAARRSANSSTMTSFTAGPDGSTPSKGGRAGGSNIPIPSALKGASTSQQGNLGPLGGAVVPTNYKAPSLRLLDLSKNDLSPIVVSELLVAVRGNEYLNVIRLIGNPLIEKGNCDDVKLLETLEADERFVL